MSRESLVVSRQSSSARIAAGLARRHRAERRFRALGLAAIGFACAMLLVLLVTVIGKGVSGFTQYALKVEVDTSAVAAQLRSAPAEVDFYTLARAALLACAPTALEDSAARHQYLALGGTFAAAEVKQAVLAHPAAWGQRMPVWIALASPADQALKHPVAADENAELQQLSPRQLKWLAGWASQGRITRRFNTDFFTRGDSRSPEAAGFAGSVVGSLLTLFGCLLLAVPIAIMAAITLEEFAGKSRLAGVIEVAINNLAAVPSILYGLLGVSVWLQWLGLPRSSALVGGMTLALLILPVMIIAARAAIRAVPPSMRLAAAALGATRLQVVRHHVLPYALPGIMTGTILSICRALGETAPLLMIGMVAFVADIPRGVSDPATAMPVEIYLWASSPERGFVEKTSAGIMVLLLILLILNLAAIRLRNKSQKEWN